VTLRISSTRPTPVRREALSQLSLVANARQVFERDLNAAVSNAMGRAAKAARSIGDDPSRYVKAQAEASIKSKMLAASIAAKTKRPYVAPDGTMPSEPTGDRLRRTDGELDRQVDTGRSVS
jgi:hypothetical protein